MTALMRTKNNVMKAEITFEQLWTNPSVRDYFFRTQSENTLNELMARAAIDSIDVCEIVDDYADRYGLDLDEIEEMFYSFGDNTVEDLAAEFGIELTNEEEDE